MNKPTITAISSYKPTKRISNEEIQSNYEIGLEKKFEKVGIESRNYEENIQGTAFMCQKIAENLKDQLIGLDTILVGTCTPDLQYPGEAFHIAKVLNIKELKLADNISMACSSFLGGIRQAVTEILLGRSNKVLVVGVDQFSKHIIPGRDYKTEILMADGAGAVIIENDLNGLYKINDTFLKTITDIDTDILCFHNKDLDDGSRMKNAYKVYQNGTTLLPSIMNEYLGSRNLKIEDFDYIIPHQANLSMLKAIKKELNIPEDKMLINIKNVGNTGAASIPLCLDEMYLNGTIKKGDRLLLCSIGAGYTFGIVDLHWGM